MSYNAPKMVMRNTLSVVLFYNNILKLQLISILYVMNHKDCKPADPAKVQSRSY